MGKGIDMEPLLFIVGMAIGAWITFRHLDNYNPEKDNAKLAEKIKARLPIQPEDKP